MAKTHHYSHVTEVVDYETGEVKTSEIISSRKIKQEPAFIKLYLADVANLTLLNESPKDTLYYLLRHVDYDNMLYLNAGLIEKLSNMQNISMASFRNNLSSLTKHGILEITSRGCYRLNPYYFAKGEWKKIEKIRLTIDYDLVVGSKTIKTTAS